MALKDILANLDIYNLYYMAHMDNIPGILERGILSYHKVQRLPHKSFALEPVQEIRERVVGATGKSIHDYVPLYFTTRTPMQWVITTRSRKRERGITIGQEDLVFVEVTPFECFHSLV